MIFMGCGKIGSKFAAGSGNPYKVQQIKLAHTEALVRAERRLDLVAQADHRSKPVDFEQIDTVFGLFPAGRDVIQIGRHGKVKDRAARSEHTLLEVVGSFRVTARKIVGDLALGELLQPRGEGLRVTEAIAHPWADRPCSSHPVSQPPL